MINLEIGSEYTLLKTKVRLIKIALDSCFFEIIGDNVDGFITFSQGQIYKGFECSGLMSAGVSTVETYLRDKAVQKLITEN